MVAAALAAANKAAAMVAKGAAGRVMVEVVMVREVVGTERAAAVMDKAAEETVKEAVEMAAEPMAVAKVSMMVPH